MSAAMKPPAASTHRNTKDNNFDRVMPRLSHTAPESVGAAIERCARALRAGRVHFGHGTANARDEAAELVFFVAGLAHAPGRKCLPPLHSGRAR